MCRRAISGLTPIGLEPAYTSTDRRANVGQSPTAHLLGGRSHAERPTHVMTPMDGLPASAFHTRWANLVVPPTAPLPIDPSYAGRAIAVVSPKALLHASAPLPPSGQRSGDPQNGHARRDTYGARAKVILTPTPDVRAPTSTGASGYASRDTHPVTARCSPSIALGAKEGMIARDALPRAPQPGGGHIRTGTHDMPAAATSRAGAAIVALLPKVDLPHTAHDHESATAIGRVSPTGYLPSRLTSGVRAIMATTPMEALPAPALRTACQKSPDTQLTRARHHHPTQRSL